MLAFVVAGVVLLPAVAPDFPDSRAVGACSDGGVMCRWS